jgi:Cu2+-exporting ATPase
MMTLISLAIVVAFAYSLAVALGLPGMALWEELATLVTIMLLGHWIEMRAIAGARGALKELAKLLPDTAARIAGDDVEEVPVGELREGDLVLVRPGSSVPADGVVREGASEVNEALLTGESRPVAKEAGDEVVAGTLNGSGSLRVEVTKIGEDTALSGILRLVGEAQRSRSHAQDLADRAALWLTIVALGAGAATLLWWLARGSEPAYAVERLVSVLVVACPHALGLAIPLVIAISTALAAREGLLVRSRRGLEAARELDMVVFDKTGTLTRGEFRVVRVAAAGIGEDEALALAAAVERDSEHTIARGIVRSAEERGLVVPKGTGFLAIPGKGARARVDGRDLVVGGPGILAAHGVQPAPELAAAADEAAADGRTVVFLIEGSRALAAIVVADGIRPESQEAVRRLQARGIDVAMLTGDSQAVADAVGRALGIDVVFAAVSPGEKVERLKELKAFGGRIAMVGDGVNDAPALLTADVGFAIGAGTGVAVEAGDIVLVRSDPRDVARAIALSQASYRKMVQNLGWATGYNVVAIPLAAGALAGQGFVLHPAVAAILMSASTVVVALNAQLLRRTRL